MTFFIDMDGVLADFVTAYCQEIDESIPNPWPNGVYDLEQIFPEHDIRFLDTIDFWYSLYPYLSGSMLIQRLQNESVYILSSPTVSAACYAGKFQWIEEHYPQFTKRLILCRNKFLLSGSDRVLIDDCRDNIEAWEQDGGIGILIPRPWNTSRDDIAERINDLVH